jgi:hypothetical protein
MWRAAWTALLADYPSSPGRPKWAVSQQRHIIHASLMQFYANQNKGIVRCPSSASYRISLPVLILADQVTSAACVVSPSWDAIQS